MNNRGFSLLELMIVLCILTGIVAISWPSLTKKTKKIEVEIFEQKIKEVFEDARYYAIVHTDPVAVIVLDNDVRMVRLKYLSEIDVFDRLFLIDARGNVYEK